MDQKILKNLRPALFYANYLSLKKVNECLRKVKFLHEKNKLIIQN